MQSVNNPYEAPKTLELERKPDVDEGGLATRSQRLTGAIIDGLIAMVFTMPLFFVTGAWKTLFAGEDLPIATTAMFALYGVVLFLAIHGYLLHTRGQTVGKLVVKTRIVGLDGKILPLPRLYVLRYLSVGVLGYIPIAGPLINFVGILIIYRQDRRCLHDHIAGTRVVKV
jgi:uncharacterized RDD family membrane protein YckC